jgi:hypothetical protein
MFVKKLWAFVSFLLTERRDFSKIARMIALGRPLGIAGMPSSSTLFFWWAAPTAL